MAGGSVSVCRLYEVTMVSMMSLREGGGRGISQCLSSVRGDHGLDDVPEGGRQEGDQSVSVVCTR